MTQYRVTPQELRKLKASDYKEGDIIKVGNYTIWIKYTNWNGDTYDTPALCSTIDRGFMQIGCTPGADRPYYLDNFLRR
jgi:hypothetical protein